MVTFTFVKIKIPPPPKFYVPYTATMTSGTEKEMRCILGLNLRE